MKTSRIAQPNNMLDFMIRKLTPTKLFAYFPVLILSGAIFLGACVPYGYSGQHDKHRAYNDRRDRDSRHDRDNYRDQKDYRYHDRQTDQENRHEEHNDNHDHDEHHDDTHHD